MSNLHLVRPDRRTVERIDKARRQDREHEIAQSVLDKFGEDIASILNLIMPFMAARKLWSPREIWFLRTLVVTQERVTFNLEMMFMAQDGETTTNPMDHPGTPPGYASSLQIPYTHDFSCSLFQVMQLTVEQLRDYQIRPSQLRAKILAGLRKLDYVYVE